MSQNIKARSTRNPLKRGGKKEVLGIKILEFFFLLIKQDAEGIQNMSGVSLIGLTFIKCKQL